MVDLATLNCKVLSLRCLRETDVLVLSLFAQNQLICKSFGVELLRAISSLIEGMV